MERIRGSGSAQSSSQLGATAARKRPMLTRGRSDRDCFHAPSNGLRESLLLPHFRSVQWRTAVRLTPWSVLTSWPKPGSEGVTSGPGMTSGPSCLQIRAGYLDWHAPQYHGGLSVTGMCSRCHRWRPRRQRDRNGSLPRVLGKIEVSLIQVWWSWRWYGPPAGSGNLTRRAQKVRLRRGRRCARAVASTLLQNGRTPQEIFFLCNRPVQACI